jgi:hypothetical protein
MNSTTARRGLSLSVNVVGVCCVLWALAAGCSDGSGTGEATDAAAAATDAQDTAQGTSDDATGDDATGDDATGDDATGDDATGDDATATDAQGGDDAADVSPEAFAGERLMTALVGLWRGPAERTPLGTFPLMNMDMRPVQGLALGDLLFSRADLDADNSLRFAFGVEQHAGADVLVFRNGGQFLGLDRDTRTLLESFDAATQTWRFCALDGGCDYVDATWTFSRPDALTLQVLVGGRQHLTWSAQRVEARDAPAPFPSADALPADAPFPPMPSLRVTVTWSPALTADAPVWVVLSTTPCGFTGRGCEASRSISARALAGSTSAEVVLHQVHPGAYKLNAVLDRDDNIQSQVFPSSGDSVALPDQAVTVGPSGESTAQSAIAVTVP